MIDVFMNMMLTNSSIIMICNKISFCFGYCFELWVLWLMFRCYRINLKINILVHPSCCTLVLVWFWQWRWFELWLWIQILSSRALQCLHWRCCSFRLDNHLLLLLLLLPSSSMFLDLVCYLITSKHATFWESMYHICSSWLNDRDKT